MGMMKTITVDFGSTPIDTKSFTDVDAGLAGLTFVEAWFMRDSTADNPVTFHEMASGLIRVACSITGTTLTLVADVIAGRVTGQFSLRYVAN